MALNEFSYWGLWARSEVRAGGYVFAYTAGGVNQAALDSFMVQGPSGDSSGRYYRQGSITAPTEWAGLILTYSSAPRSYAELRLTFSLLSSSTSERPRLEIVAGNSLDDLRTLYVLDSAIPGSLGEVAVPLQSPLMVGGGRVLDIQRSVPLLTEIKYPPAKPFLSSIHRGLYWSATPSFTSGARIFGTTTCSGNPVRRVVRAYDAKSMTLLGSALSGVDGAFSIDVLDPSAEYLVLAQDADGQQNAVVFDRVKPYVPPV